MKKPSTAQPGFEIIPQKLDLERFRKLRAARQAAKKKLLDAEARKRRKSGQAIPQDQAPPTENTAAMQAKEIEISSSDDDEDEPQLVSNGEAGIDIETSPQQPTPMDIVAVEASAARERAAEFAEEQCVSSP